MMVMKFPIGKRKMQKKGSLFDMIYLSVYLFVVALVIGIGWLIYSSINTEWQSHTELGTESLAIMQDAKDRYVVTWDGVFLTLVVGLYIASLILAYNIDANPIYFFLSLFMIGVIAIITGAMGNAWNTISTNPAMSGYIDDFTVIPWVMGHYVEMFVVMGFGLMGVMYVRAQ